VSTFLGFTIVGLSSAAIYAVIASGLVLTYTTTGVFNFSHGAIGMLAAFGYWQLHEAWNWPAGVAVAFMLLVAAPLLGVGLELLMRGLRDTSETARLVVSVSLLFGMIGIAQAVWNPSIGRSVPEFFAGSKVDLGPTTVTYHQLTTILVAVAAAVGLRLLLYRTRAGVSMRAVVDDPPLSQLNGVNTPRVQRASWIISVVLAATGGVLVASTAGLNAIVLSMLIVNAYAAAMFGRLRSLPITFLGAGVVGLLDGYLHGYLPNNQYLTGFRLAAPVILLFLVLLVLPNPRLRGTGASREYFPEPTRRGGLLFCGFTLLAGVMLATTLSPTGLLTYGKLFPTAIICLSLVPLVGFANQVSLCQLSLAGIGAVVYGHLGTGGNPIGLVAAVVVAAVVGALVALPALRLSGIYLALATAAFAVALDRWIFTMPDFDIGPVHIAILGNGSVPATGVRYHSVGFTTPRSLMVLALVVFVLLAGAVMALRRGRFGRRLVALRDSEAACATFGMNLISARVLVFALSAAIAGLGGALSAMQAGTVQAQDYDFVSGLPLFLLVAVGGAGFVSAGLFAAVFYQGFFPFLGVVAPWLTKWQALGAGGSGVSIGKEPNGAAPQFRDGFRHLAAAPGILATMVGAMVLAWALRLVGVFGNWPFVLVVGLAFVAAATGAEVGARRRGLDPSWVRPGAVRRRVAPGATFAAELADLDAQLGLAGVALDDAAARRSDGALAAAGAAG